MNLLLRYIYPYMEAAVSEIYVWLIFYVLDDTIFTASVKMLPFPT